MAYPDNTEITCQQTYESNNRCDSTIAIRADAVILLGQRVGGGPAGDGRVVHPGAEVEERDARAEERLILLAGEVPAVRGGCGGHRGCRGYRGDYWLRGI